MSKSAFRSFLIIAIAGIMAASCVPSRQYEDEKAKRLECEQSNKALKSQNEQYWAQINENNAKLSEMGKRLEAIKKDTTILGSSLRTMTNQYDKINELNKQLIEQLEKLKAGNELETEKISGKLLETQEELLKKEEALRKLEAELAAKKKSLDELSLKLAANQKALDEKELKLNELQSILNQKDSVVNALKKTVSDALLGFEGKGLTVEQKNGKVYVSLENSLLFASGSWAVAPEGKKALKQLAQVLAENPDINVLVEGHTDDVPYRGNTGIEDNWDLSVKRATVVVKILLENQGVNAQKITAAGRSKFVPLEEGKTPEIRKKNRRTEIILTPKLDELFQILEQN